MTKLLKVLQSRASLAKDGMLISTPTVHLLALNSITVIALRARVAPVTCDCIGLCWRSGGVCSGVLMVIL